MNCMMEEAKAREVPLDEVQCPACAAQEDDKDPTHNQTCTDRMH